MRVSRLAVLMLVACDGSEPCSTEARGSVLVTLTDGSGGPIADATVTFRADGAAETPCDGLPDGTFVCGWEVDGDVTVTATAWRHAPATETVTVGRDDCHVLTEALTLVLDPLDCTTEVVPSVEVTVVGSTGEVLDGVVVRYWPEGATGDAVACDGPHPPEVWRCGDDQAGALVVEASADGHVTEQQTVVVEADVCHVITEHADFALDWAPDR